MTIRGSGRYAAALALAALLGLLPGMEEDLTAQGTLSPGPTFTVDDVLDVRNVSIEDVSADGRWVAATTAALRDRIGVDNYRYGDPTYVAPSVARVWSVDVSTGEREAVFEEPRQVAGFAWSPNGESLAMLVREGDDFVPMVWHRPSGDLRTLTLPTGTLPVIGGRGGGDPHWSADGASIYLDVRTEEWTEEARRRFLQLTEGPIVKLSSEEPFLAWEALAVHEYRRAIVALDPEGGAAREIVPERSITSFAFSADGRWLRYTEFAEDSTDYESNRGSSGRVRVVDMGNLEERVLFEPDSEIDPAWSEDGAHYAYAKDDSIFVGSVANGELVGFSAALDDGDESPEDGEDEPDRLRPVSLGLGGSHLVASGARALWSVDVATGDRSRISDLPERRPRSRLPQLYQVAAWSPDGQYVYLEYAAQDAWERGVSRYDVAAGTLSPLLRSGDLLGDLELSRDGSTFIHTAAPGNHPLTLRAADAGFSEVRTLFDPNPDISRKDLSETELIRYLDVDGTELYGVVYHPVGQSSVGPQPTIFLVYEDFFDDRFNGTVQYLTSHGYVVVNPSVKFETGYPEEAWVKGVTAAANKLIEMGVTDPERMGVHGTSYGGYATNLLITQTDRFEAAINISGKVNMVSFYTDSPRLGIRNIRAPEWGQDRVGATLWEQPQKYISTSAIMDADRIDTPLLLMTGRQDHNVPARQAMEMYYALRRLGKTVEWVEYVNGGHGMPRTTVEEVEDYHRRILAWYDRFLKGDSAAEITSPARE